MSDITFDRFDAGLLLERPSSVAPANSLSELSNVDVQAGGTLRNRPTWRHAPSALQVSDAWKGLESGVGYLWTFGIAAVAAAPSISDIVDAATGLRLVYAFRSVGAGGNFAVDGPTAELRGTTRWTDGFVATQSTGAAVYNTLFTVNTVTNTVAATPILDANMPVTGLMVTAGNRVYAVGNDGQTVRFSKVGDVTDWTTAGDAGFLPVAQHFGSGQKVYALGLYQGKLAVFTDQSVQLWIIDPDPTAMALDRVVDGIGTRHHRSVTSLGGDLLFLSESGVRSLTTLSNALFPSDVDVGLPVKSSMPSPGDVHIAYRGSFMPSVIALAASPFAQYWIAAPGAWNIGTTVPAAQGWYAWGFSRQGKLNAWARHYAGGGNRAIISCWAALGNRVFMRHNKDDFLNMMTPGVYTAEQTEAGSPIACTVKTQWLDFGKPGKRKTIFGIDFDGINVDSIDIQTSSGGDRTGILAATIPISDSQSGWTYSGEMIPVEDVDGTEFRLTLTGFPLSELQLNRVTLYYNEIDS